MRLDYSKTNLLATAGLLALGTILSSCSREPQNVRPKVGETVSLEPIPNDMLHLTKGAAGDSIKLEVTWGGHPVKNKTDLTLRFLDEKDAVVYEKSWQELETSYKTTDCLNEHIAKLDGYLLGVALICDGSLDLSQVKRIEGVDKKGKKRQTKSWTAYPLGQGVKAVSIGLY